MADIQISYQNVISKADELDDLAGKLKNIRDNEFQDMVNDINGAWDGTASEEMMKKVWYLHDKLDSAISNLTLASGVLRQHARDWYNREKAIQEAMRLAEEARKQAKKIIPFI